MRRRRGAENPGIADNRQGGKPPEPEVSARDVAMAAVATVVHVGNLVSSYRSWSRSATPAPAPPPDHPAGADDTGGPDGVINLGRYLCSQRAESHTADGRHNFSATLVPDADADAHGCDLPALEAIRNAAVQLREGGAYDLYLVPVVAGE